MPRSDARIGTLNRRTLVRTFGGTVVAGAMPGGIGASLADLPEATGDSRPAPRPTPMGVLSTRGSSIVDSTGNPVLLKGIGWFEGYSKQGMLAGLEAVSWQQTMKDMEL